MAVGPKYTVSFDLPSKEELQKVEQIRQRCQREIDALTIKADDVVGDIRITRFLRSKQGDVREAADWFREFLQWRVESSIETDRLEVVGRTPEELLQWYAPRRNPYFPLCPYAGRNDDGHVIWLIRPGMLEARKFMEHRQCPKEKDKAMLFQLLEWTLWHLDVLSRQEGRMAFVIKCADFRGLGSDGRPLPVFVSEFKAFFLDYVKQMQKFYCDHDSAFAILNAPFAFRAVFAILKVILTKRQTGKIKLFGDVSKPENRKSLTEFVPDSCLTKENGGLLDKVTGVYPVATPEEISVWYDNRHLVPVELAPTGTVAEDTEKAEEEAPQETSGTAALPEEDAQETAEGPTQAPQEEPPDAAPQAENNETAQHGEPPDAAPEPPAEAAKANASPASESTQVPSAGASPTTGVEEGEDKAVVGCCGAGTRRRRSGKGSP